MHVFCSMFEALTHDNYRNEIMNECLAEVTVGFQVFSIKNVPITFPEEFSLGLNDVQIQSSNRCQLRLDSVIQVILSQ